MKQFSIHKVNKPVLGQNRGGGAMADEVADVSKLGADGGDVSTYGGNRNGEE